LVDFEKIPMNDGDYDKEALKQYAKHFASEHSRVLEASKPKIESRAANFSNNKGVKELSKEEIINALKSGNY
jgi:hypothetical protein